MGNRIGWYFPPTGGGKVDRFNDSGIAHFDGNPLVSLARETIQNSLDANDGEGPVEVAFEIEEIERSDSLGREELAAAVKACLDELGDDEAKARAMLNHATELLECDRLPYLRVSDRNTTGLRNGHWKALVKWQGASVKEKRSAGGSHGIGKFAPFAVSPLRTVYYWTRFEDGNASREWFQGKAVLMSHADSGAGGVETQGTGFYGIVDGCRELSGRRVPERIRRIERGRGNGTSLWIAGFPADRDTDDWQEKIANSIVTNFFYAIEHEMLSVVIEPNREMGDLGLLRIDKSTLAEWFDYLEPDISDGQPRAEEEDAVAEARLFWEVTGSSKPSAETEDRDLGLCRLWVRVSDGADGLPSKVGFVRGTGMLITTQQPGLIRFRGLKEFIAVCVFDSEKGNELLRMMENPRHDRFEHDRLPEHEQGRGRRALGRIVSWIRGEISKLAAPPAAGQVTDLGELAQYLPDLEPDDDFDPPEPKGDEGGERVFSGPAVIRLKPRRPTAVRALPEETDESPESEGGDGDDPGSDGGGGDGTNEGDGGSGTGPDEGAGKGGQGDRGGSSGLETIQITDVRLVPVAGQENRYRVSFVGAFGGEVRLEIVEAGDSTAIGRDDVQAFGLNGEPLDLDRVQLTEGKRTAIEITGSRPIGGRAWRVRAVRQERQ